MLTSARIASASTTTSAAVAFGCCLNHMVVASGIVHLFQIGVVARRARDSYEDATQPGPIAPGRTPLATRIFLRGRRGGFHGSAKRCTELSARADIKLAVDPAEML